ncbi:MAG TPA: fibronectin type III domain-containing protein [Polyangia bacterium]
MALLSASALACGDDAPAPSAATPDASNDVGGNDLAPANADAPVDGGGADAVVDLDAAVTGTSVSTVAGVSGTESRPRDLSRYVVGAWTGTAQADYRLGWGTSEGTFVVPNVPPGPFTLDVRSSATASSTAIAASDLRRFDLGSEFFGHPDRLGTRPASAPGTAIELAATNLQPWRASDQLRVETDVGLSHTFSSNQTEGATTQSWLLTYGSALDGPGRGHELQVKQWRATLLPSGGWLRTACSGVVTQMAATREGQTTKLALALAPLPADELIKVDVRRSQFLKHLAAMSPGGAQPTVSVTAQRFPPGLMDADSLGPTDALIEVPPGNGDVLIEGAGTTLSPKAWSRSLDVRVEFPISITVPGSLAPLVAVSVMRIEDEAERLQSAPVVPLLGPVRALSVEGRAAAADQVLLGVGLRPAISWSPPELGRPSLYEISVRRIDVRVERSTEVVVAVINTEGTTAIIPGNTLEPGHWYRLVVRAINSERRRAASPHRESRPLVTTSIFSGRFTP